MKLDEMLKRSEDYSDKWNEFITKFEEGSIIRALRLGDRIKLKDPYSSEMVVWGLDGFNILMLRVDDNCLVRQTVNQVETMFKDDVELKLRMLDL